MKESPKDIDLSVDYVGLDWRFKIVPKIILTWWLAFSAFAGAKTIDFLVDPLRTTEYRESKPGPIERRTEFPDNYLYGGLIGILFGGMIAYNFSSPQCPPSDPNDDYDNSSRSAGEHYPFNTFH